MGGESSTPVPPLLKCGSNIGVKLADSIKEKLGAFSVDSIKSHLPKDLLGQAGYLEMKKIMKDTIKKDLPMSKLKEIETYIFKTIKWIAQTYNIRKRSGISRKELFEMLHPKEEEVASKFIPILSQLCQSEIALGVFVVTAGFHLMLLQELAHIDPNEILPSSSSFARSLKEYAVIYGEYAENTYNTIFTTRMEYISGIYVESVSVPDAAGRNISDTCYCYKDKVTDKEYTFKEPRAPTNSIKAAEETYQKAQESRDKYTATITENLLKNLNDPLKCSLKWRQTSV